MNNVLFGVIGLFMMAITGLGFAEVKEQADARVAVTQRGVAADTGSEQAASDVQKTTTPETPSVAGSLARVTQKVADAIDDVTIGRSHGDSDDDEDDWGETDEGDDDDRASSRTTAVAAAPAQTPASPSQQSAQGSVGVQNYTMAQVAAHNSSASCWSAINGSVYDLTSFISQHPGGQAAIKSLCGVDGSAAFNGQHGGQARPASELVGFKIGVLK